MVKVNFNQVRGKWETLPDGDNGGIYLDGFLRVKLDNIKEIISKGWDAVILIDGKERSGKSILGITCGYYLSDGTLNEKNFASGLNDAIDKIRELPDGSVLVVDEGSLVFNSKDAMKAEQVKLQKILDVVGQKNMIFIVILPSIFDLNKNIAVRRSRFLLHVYTDEKMERGRFAYFSEIKKAMLYELGKKNFGSYEKPEPDFYGRFVNFKPHFYDKYLEIKRKSLMEALDNKKPIVSEEVRKSIIAEAIIKFRRNCPEVSVEQIQKGFGIPNTSYYRLISKENDLPKPSTPHILYNLNKNG